VERERAEVPPAEIEAFCEQLQEVLTGLPAGFLFNADETGYQEWANRTVQQFVVPVSHPDEVIAVPFNRSSTMPW
jgi:hypothetical protein